MKLFFSLCSAVLLMRCSSTAPTLADYGAFEHSERHLVGVLSVDTEENG